MAKNINHLQHVKSSVVENGMPKLPAPSVLVEGELAVNYAADKETISLKNSSGVVVTFSSDNYYSEKKLGSGFTGENSGVTVTQAINDTEKVIAAALNDLDSRKLDASAYTPTDLSDYATKEWVNEERLGSGFTGENSGRTVTQVIEDDELAISAALNDLNTRKLDTSGYTPGKLDIWRVTDFDFASAGYSCNDLMSYMQGEKCLVIANMENEEEYPSGYYALGSANGNIYAILDEGFMSFTVFLDCDGSDIVVADHRVNEYYTAVSSVTVNNSTIVPTDGDVNLGTVVSSVTVNGSAVTVTNGVAPINITATYDSNTKKIYLKNGNTTMSEIDATDFIKDGMVNDVVVDEPVSGSNSGVTCLIVTFNTDAGKEDIEIPLSEMFDSELYYTKEEVNTMLGNDFIDFSGESFSSVTDIIRADETVMAAALNDLNNRKLDASAYTPSEFTDLLDEKLGYWFSGDSLSSVTDVIRENEIIVASALNDLDSRKLDASAYTPTDLSDYATKEWVNEERLGDWFTGENSGRTVTDELNDINTVTAAALNDLNTRKADKSDIIDKLGEWFSGDSTNVTVTSVIRDDERAIAAALNDLDERKLDASAFTQDEYATKEWVENDILGSGFTGEYSGKSITEVIEENELIIASALNDLDERIDELSGNTGGGGAGATVWSDIGYWSPDGSGLDFSNHTFSELEGIFQGGGDLMLADMDGLLYRTSAADNGFYIFVGNNLEPSSPSGGTITHPCIVLGDDGNDIIRVIPVLGEASGVIVSGEYDDGTLYLDKNDGTHLEISGFTTGGGGGTGDLSGVTFNGVAATKSNGVAAITANVVSSVTMNSTNKSINNGALDLGTVITAETQLSTATTGTGVVVTGLTVSNHKITTNMGNITLDNVADGSTRKLPTALSALTADATHRLVTDTEKTNWNNAATNSHTHGNLSVLEGITSQKVTNWDNAYTSAHSHSNKSALDGIDTTKVGNWDNAATNAHNHDNKAVLDSLSASVITNSHTHSNKGVLDNLTQAVIDNNHTHSNKSVIDGITTAKTAQWDNAISAVSFNGTDATVTNHKAAITATIPTSLSQLTSAHTHAISEVTNLQSTLNAKVSGITVNGGSKVTPTNGVANLTINASTVGAMASGTTLDGIADGTTRKLSDYATTGTVNTHTGNTAIHLPAVTAADNGKILMVVNGQWALVNPTTIYTGTGTPSSSQGNDGDIYLQTS